MAAMGVASAQGQSETAPNCEKGIQKAFGKNNPGFDNRAAKANERLGENFERCITDGGDTPL